jgi:hypothetical protein
MDLDVISLACNSTIFNLNNQPKQEKRRQQQYIMKTNSKAELFHFCEPLPIMLYCGFAVCRPVGLQISLFWE